MSRMTAAASLAGLLAFALIAGCGGADSPAGTAAGPTVSAPVATAVPAPASTAAGPTVSPPVSTPVSAPAPTAAARTASPPVATSVPAPAPTSAAAPGDALATAAPFELPSAAGQPVALASYLDERNVVLVFYRTYQWGVCRGQLVELSDAYPTIKSLGAELLAISTDNVADARSAVARLGLSYPILYDPGAEVVRAYEVYNLLGDELAAPATFIVDKAGKIRWSYIGAHVSDRPSTTQIIGQLQRVE